MISITIDDKSSIPKYRQIINSIVGDIEGGILKKDLQLPSINELSEEYYLSRDTVEKAYVELRERGIIVSVPGKGYFINKTEGLDKANVFLLFNKLSGYKKIIYDSFVQALGEKGKVDLYIYHNDAKIFEELIKENLGSYNFYVIIPHFFQSPGNLVEILSSIPKNKLVILDKKLDDIALDECAAVFQNFEKDIKNALLSLKDSLTKYKELVMVFPEKSYHPKEIKKGFLNFCKETGFQNKIIEEILPEAVNTGEAYLVLEEKDLVQLLKQTKANNYKPGHEIGIISYNEDPLKELLFEGLTVVSTDFMKMGQLAADIILNKKTKKTEVPFRVIRRNSL
jgi:DNA-binding transcriptional regulator YhcF (GntR family)